MQYQCAWCQKELRSTRPGQDEPISHGICLECARAMLNIPAESMQAYLERFAGPVILVDADVSIITANTQAYALLGQDAPAASGNSGGEAIGCLHADQPGGCGSQVHCKTCTIRLLVSDTLQSGRAHTNVPAYIDLHRLAGDKSVRFHVTTEKMGPAVLLRIDAVDEEPES